MVDATSPTLAAPKITARDLNTFARIDVLGLQVQAQQVWPDKTVLFCKPVLPDSTLVSAPAVASIAEVRDYGPETNSRSKID